MQLKKLLIPLISSVIAIGTVTPVVACTLVNHQKITSNANNVQYTFNNQTFNNRSQLFSYARSIANEKKYTTVNRDKWSIQYNGQTHYFSDINDLFNFLSDKIVQHKGSSSYPLVVDADGGVSQQSVWDANLDVDNINTTTIYKGNNDTYFTNEQDAKDSYLEIHEAYLFNGIYFRTKEELKSYITLNYDAINDNTDRSIVVVSPNNNYSQPIDIQKLKDKDPYETNKFSSFVSLYANKYLEAESNNNSTDQKEYIYYDANDIKNNEGNILARFDNPSYVPINSNQGNSNYLIDLNQADKANLYGPYYTKGTATLANINNPDCWSKAEGTSWNFNDNQKIAQLLSSFMDMLVNEDDSSPYPFNVSELKQGTEEYFTYLNNNYPYVYDSVMDLYNTMKSGKRYSLFYKLPILYVKTLEELIYKSAKQEAIVKTISYYKKVAQCFDERLYAIVPSIFLEPKEAGTYQKLSFVNLFHIGAPLFDLNSDIEAFADIINQEYPNFVQYLNFVSVPIYIGLYFPDLFDYDESFIRSINSNFNFDFNKFGSYFKSIWNMATTTDDATIESFIKTTYKENTNQDINEDSLGYLVNQFSLSKQVFLNNAQKKMEEMIKSYIGIYNDDILYNYLYDGVFSPLSLVNLYKYNNNKIDYRAFAYLIIHGKFQNKNIKPFKYTDQNELKKLEDICKEDIKTASKEKIIDVFPRWLFDNFLDAIHVTEDTKNIISINKNNYVKKYADNTIEIISKVFKLEGEYLDTMIACVSSVFPVISVVSAVAKFCFDLIVPKLDKFSYVFESEGNKYIWDGGKERQWLFGLIHEEISSIDDMKMNQPIQVTKQHLVNGYYYNGKIYDDLTTLKRNQLDDILNDRFESDDVGIRTVYSFNSLDNTSYIGRPQSGSQELVFDNIGTLIDDCDTDLIDYVYQSVINDTNSPYANDNVYAYAGGYTFDQSIAMEKNIEELVDKIKPVKIAMVPKLNNGGMPIDGDAIPEYKLPGQSWTSMGGLNQNTLDDYVILDPNTKEDNQKSIQTINDLFYNQFNVENKTILSNNLYKYNQYSSYNNNINNFYLYEVRLENGYRKYFNNKSQALKWFMQQCNFKVYNTFNDIYEYSYGDLTFDSLDAYLNWVLANSEVKYE